MGQVDDGPGARLAATGQFRQSREKCPAQLGQPAVIARVGRASQQARAGRHRLKNPDPTLEEARQTIQVGRLSNQGVETRDAQHAPAQPV